MMTSHSALCLQRVSQHATKFHVMQRALGVGNSHSGICRRLVQRKGRTVGLLSDDSATYRNASEVSSLYWLC